LAKQFEGTELLFERRAGEKDVLFGSVSVADIANRLTAKGLDIDRKRIALEHPIKELGTFEVEINIHREVKVTLPVFVVRPGEEADRGGEGEVEPEAAVVETVAAPESETEAAVE
jgi:large subunit ribosomal protein L9